MLTVRPPSKGCCILGKTARRPKRSREPTWVGLSPHRRLQRYGAKSQNEERPSARPKNERNRFPSQKLEPALLRKIQSMDGGLGLPVSRNGLSSQPLPRVSNWTSSSSGLAKPPGGPTVIEEPFKKLKKPSPQSQTQSRSIPAPSNNGISKAEGEKKQGGEGRGLAPSTSNKSLSDSSCTDTTESKVWFQLESWSLQLQSSYQLWGLTAVAFSVWTGLNWHQKRPRGTDSLIAPQRR